MSEHWLLIEPAVFAKLSMHRMPDFSRIVWCYQTNGLVIQSICLRKRRAHCI